MADENENSCDKFDDVKPDKMFTLKKWNAVAMWSWDVECDTCAICRVQVMGKLFQYHSFNYSCEYRLSRKAPFLSIFYST
uniref:Putative scf ubiquitin ligase rbx1 component n=1 Tax=Anopheles triannulatus TaxID=58253 RepID=A0A2M4AYG0_9DIPT